MAYLPEKWSPLESLSSATTQQNVHFGRTGLSCLWSRLKLALVLLFTWTMLGDWKREVELYGPDFRFELEAVRLMDEQADKNKSDGEFASACATYQKALALTEEKLGKRTRDSVHLKILLADAHRSLGDLDSAFRYASEAHQLAGVLCNKGHPLFLGALAQLASIKASNGQLVEAKDHLKQILNAGENSPEPIRVAATANLGAILLQEGDAVAALELLQQGFPAVERLYGTNSLELADVLDFRSLALTDLAWFEQASSDANRSLTIRQRELAPGHYKLAQSMNNVAGLMSAMGKHSEALRIYVAALSNAEASLGWDHPSTASVLDNLATAFQRAGDLAQGLRAARRALAIREKHFGEEAESVAESLETVGTLLLTGGQLFEAQAAYLRALRIWGKSRQPRRLSVARLSDRLALCLQLTGKGPKAAELLDSAYLIYSEMMGEDHPTTLQIGERYLSQLIRNGTNQFELLESLVIRRASILGANHPDVCGSWLHLSQLQREFGRISEARTSIAEALRISRTLDFTVDAVKADVMEAAATAYAADSQNLAARIMASFVVGYFRINALQQLRELSPRESLGPNSRVFNSLKLLHAIARADWENGIRMGQEDPATHLAASKALRLEVEAARVRLELSPETQVGGYLSTFSMLQSQLEALGQAKIGAVERDERRRLLQQQMTEISREIGQRIEKLEISQYAFDLEGPSLAGALPAGSVLIDVFRYSRYEVTNGTLVWRSPRYGAYLTFPRSTESPEGKVLNVDFGESGLIDQSLAQLHRLISDNRIAPSRLGPVLSRLGELVYAPLAPHLTNVAHLIICPDGELGRLPFDLLPVGNTGRHLIEDKRISYVSSGREVVRLAEPRTSVPTNAPVVMGFPDFDLSLAAANGELAGQQARPDSAAAFVAVRTPATLSRDARGHHFDPLPATEREARSAAKLLGEDCVLLLGFAAREAELKRVVSPRILHLATHGFYVTDQEFRATNSLPDLLASSAGPRFGRRPVNEDWENPLIRCGVALAGANHAGGLTNATAEDGILTGLEASLLQLQGTELVILSACQTGAGDVRIGEGVMSLRRAFTIAGAQSVLASHWRVSDEATSRLITEFLRHWRAGKPRVEALREAQLALLRSKEYSSPYFWAAFTLTGQWR
jgi:CHAT domain-containing protein